MQSKDFILAERYLQEALAMWRVLDDRHGVANVLNDLGALAQKHNDYNAAARYFREASTIYERLQQPNLMETRELTKILTG